MEAFLQFIDAIIVREASVTYLVGVEYNEYSARMANGKNLELWEVGSPENGSAVIFELGGV